jgi:transcriptional regulator with XRE-family HTH domain
VPERAQVINEAVLRLLKEARKEQGLSMGALASRASVNRTYVSRLEAGVRQPTVVVAAALADALDLSLSDLILRAERIADGDDASEGGRELELVPAPPRREVDRRALGEDSSLQQATGLTAEVIAASIEDTYHTLDLLDRQLRENGAPPFAELVELANLSSMIGNIVGGAIARHSGSRYERSGPHKYQDLRSTEGGEHVEIKTALETNKPKGHLSKAGYYLTFRYVLCGEGGGYRIGKDNRGQVVYVWEVRFGWLNEEDFDESNTAGDSGKTAVVKTAVFRAMERVYFDSTRFPYAKLDGPWGYSSISPDQ